MLKVTPLSENVMPPPAALKAKSADDLKEPALSPGIEREREREIDIDRCRYIHTQIR